MAEITFPGGQVVRVEFDDVAHSYVVAHQLANGEFSDWRPTHGITAPLEVVPKPFLKPWAAKMAAEKALWVFHENPQYAELVPQLIEDQTAMNENLRTPEGKPVMSYYRFKKMYPWLSEIKSAFKEKSDDAKEIGTWLHASIENYYNSGRKELPILTPLVEGSWNSFLMFDQFFKPTPETLEFIVYSLMFGYSGQGDFRGVMNGKTCIGDWKSTNRSAVNIDGMSVEYFFQVGGLAQAEFERTGVWVDDLFVANFDKKGEEPRVLFASEFGMSPQDAAKAYVSCFNNYHMIDHWDFKFKKR